MLYIYILNNHDTIHDAWHCAENVGSYPSIICHLRWLRIACACWCRGPTVACCASNFRWPTSKAADELIGNLLKSCRIFAEILLHRCCSRIQDPWFVPERILCCVFQAATRETVPLSRGQNGPPKDERGPHMLPERMLLRYVVRLYDTNTQ